MPVLDDFSLAGRTPRPGPVLCRAIVEAGGAVMVHRRDAELAEEVRPDIEDPLLWRIRCLDKLVDELAKGKAMDKVLRAPAPDHL